ncbi:MAG: sigma-54-dependent Fis family transcriptional regulator [Deltaproteobacteria bacterium]|nr:sigma-54-dependent Fis family transcriptional regulator [Deltaproteobacteria bacterium]
MARILVVDDEPNVRKMLRALLSSHGFEIDEAADGEAALARAREEPPDFVLADVRMPKMDGITLSREIAALDLPTTVIVMSAYGTVETAIEAMRAGAYDYIMKPFRTDEVLLTLRKAEEREQLRRENRELRRRVSSQAVEPPIEFSGLLARSATMQRIFKTVAKLADVKTTVLLSGESGTGKELVARALHERSLRASHPFVAVNCGAIPETLLESELFGFRRGAFTGADRDKRGLIEEADQGTLFLDEVAEIPAPLQVKLLRVLQEETIRPLGDTADRKVDVRFVAATGRDLAEDVAAGRFREDLYYRLNVLALELPPLRARKEDVLILAEHFLDRECANLGKHRIDLAPDARRALLDYPWPGNVRELENAIERAVVLAEGERIGASDLPGRILAGRDPIRAFLASGELSVKKTERFVEETLIRRALEETGGNRTAAAKLLEISHRALLYKMKEYGIR